LKNKEKKDKLGIPLSIDIIGNEESLWESRQGERRLIARELFWWLIGRKYEFGSVVERRGEERFKFANLKVIYEDLMNACSL
jgi:hypothetical protein